MCKICRATMVETKASKIDAQFPSLPDEIIMAILSKLPVKSLLQYRSVSKSWLALISSSEFVKNHLNSSANDKLYNNHKVILRWEYNKICECSLPALLYDPITELSEIDYPMNDLDIKWSDSINGLICLAGTEKSDRIPEPEVNLCIWNPSTRKGKILPRVIPILGCRTYFRYGFGYDEIHNEYKMVVIFNFFDDTRVDIYSLKTDYSWRTVRGFPGGTWIDCSAKCVMGKLYWTSLIVHGYDMSHNIVSFDLANETWAEVENPDCGEGKFDLTLGILGNDLVVLCNYERHHSDVWVLNDCGVKASWKKMFTVRCPPDPRNDMFPNSNSFISFFPFFCQSYKGEVLLLFRSVFMIYNPKEDSIRKVEVDDLLGWFEAVILVESLVNPFVHS